VRFRCLVDVYLKEGLLDPQGKAIEGALPAMGWSNVSDVRVGKNVTMEVEAPDRDTALTQVHEMAQRLLSNPVIEVFSVRSIEANEGVRFRDLR